MEDIARFIKDFEAYQALGGPKHMVEFLGGAQIRDLRDALEAAGLDREVTFDDIRESDDKNFKRILFFPHRSTSHLAVKSRLLKLKMANDSAEFVVYQEYKRAFMQEMLFSGDDFVLPPKTMVEVFVNGLKPHSLQETIRSLKAHNLEEVDH